MSYLRHGVFHGCCRFEVTATARPGVRAEIRRGDAALNQAPDGSVRRFDSLDRLSLVPLAANIP